MKKIQVTYFFEDSGFCKDVFKSVIFPITTTIVTLQAECGTPQHRTIMQMTAVSGGM